MSLGTASSEAIKCMCSGMVHSIHYVYDYNEIKYKSFWSHNLLKKVILSKAAEKYVCQIVMSNKIVLCDKEDMSYNHPVFGYIKRAGWALMKKGREMAITLSL